MRPNKTVLALCAVLAAPVSWAQVGRTQTSPDPADPGAPVPATAYRSPFAGYRPLKAEEPVAGWRAANDEVGRIGGWRAYAREAQAPEPKPAGATGKTTPGAPPQGGHGMHGMPGGRQ